MEWTISVGQALSRTALHEQYGGRRQNGIAMSRQTPNVMLFTSGRGARYGYMYDCWHADGTYHYTGEGQIGDQEFRQGNAAILRHREEGRALRLFEAEGTIVTYLGEFEIDKDQPYEIADAPDLENATRSVIVFRLRPVDAVVPSSLPHESGPVIAQQVDIEAINVASVEVEIAGQTQQKVRREAELVDRYRGWLRDQGIASCRYKIVLDDDPTLMFTDLFDLTRREIIEAKASSSRVDLRMAAGQLLDYRRHVPHQSCAVLVPTRPRPDLLAYLSALGLGCVVETDGGFERVLEGQKLPSGGGV